MRVRARRFTEGRSRPAILAALLLGVLTAGTAVIPAGGDALGGSSVETPPIEGTDRYGGRWVPAVVPKPRIRRMLIPFGPKRKRQMARYSRRHYGKYEWRLRKPRQIVQHVAVAGTVRSTYNTFKTNRPDPGLGELPNLCAHYAISPSGRIYQFVKLKFRCRHVIGLNHVTIGIEHVGYRAGDVLSRRRQMRSSIRLTRWLRCAYGINTRNVIGHAESLRSRYYRERVEGLKGQTHSDFRRSSMKVYRKKLRKAGLCFVRTHGGR